MSVSTHTANKGWIQANQRYLMWEIARMRQTLQQQISQTQEHPIERVPIAPQPEPLSPPPALEQLCSIFDLSPFERSVLLLCAGMELDCNWDSLCAAAQGNLQRNYPTFSLALAAFPESDWGALIPSAPLRRWGLIEVGAGNAFTTSPLRIDERILHCLTGIQHLDERLMGMIEPLNPGMYGGDTSLQPSHQKIAGQLSANWLQVSNEPLPVVQLCGEDVASKRAIATAVCQDLKLNLYTLSGETIPTEATQLNQLISLCNREYALSNIALLLDCDEVEAAQGERGSSYSGGVAGSIAQFIENINAPLIITCRERRRQKHRPLISFDVHNPTTNEQRAIWKNALGEFAPTLNGQIETLVSHFNLNAPAIQAACWKVKSLERARWQEEEMTREDDGNNSPSPIQNHLWDICRIQARSRLDELAQRIESAPSWDDLVLPERERSVLRDIAAHVRQRAKVYETWGFGSKSKRGLGISALFAGASGTGKTMAAEVLGHELRLDVYRIDLSTIVSKYIGETEKNLRRVFDAAEGAGAILLFDEADALFGKRSEVKDSHDRYANIEVGYLLQRMESYRGLAILTTNLKGSIDQAFLRRIRFVVQFPFPDSTQRAEIWRRVFPQQTPTHRLNFDKLAKLNVAGGNIRNIALNSAFLAADAGESVGMKHILEAAMSEYVKLERPLTDTEVKGWV